MEISKKKKKWLIQRRSSLKGVFVGKRINSNKSADIYYRRALDKETSKFVKKLVEEIKNNLPEKGIYKTSSATQVAFIEALLNKYKDFNFNIYTGNITKIVQKWLRMTKNNAMKSIKGIFDEMAGKSIAIEWNKKYDMTLKLIIDRNISLIRNATSQTLNNIENIVFDAMTTGQGWRDIEKQLRRQTDYSEKRIKLIARDQTAKTNGAMNEISQRSAGIKYFEWSTSKDERVSTGKGGHKQLEGKIYRWDEPERYPVIDSYGNRGTPTQRVNCRCVALPVIILDGYHAVWTGDGYKIERI